MIEKFNGVFYLILFVIHFLGVGAYAYQMIIGNQKFREKFEIDKTAATIMRMAGAIFLGSFLMAMYVMFVRSILEYGNLAYMGAAQSHLDKLDRVQESAMKLGGFTIETLESRR